MKLLNDINFDHNVKMLEKNVFDGKISSKHRDKKEEVIIKWKRESA